MATLAQERSLQRGPRSRRPGSGGGPGGGGSRQSARKTTVMMSPLADAGLTRDPDVNVAEEHELLRKKFGDIDERRLKEHENYQRSQRATSANEQANPFVFLDFHIADVPVGRVIIELFEDVVPQTVANFRALCCGERGFDTLSGQKLDYADTLCHRIVKGQGACFGEFNGLSISADGGTFPDERYKYMHGERGVLSMVSRGPNTNGSSFMVTFGPAPALDYKQVVFGRIDEGLQFLERIEAVATDRCGVPKQNIVINFCGVVRGERPQPAAFPSLEEYEKLMLPSITPTLSGVGLQQFLQSDGRATSPTGTRRSSTTYVSNDSASTSPSGAPPELSKRDSVSSATAASASATTLARNSTAVPKPESR